MPNVVKESICKLFADDCKLYRVIENEEDRKLQADVELGAMVEGMATAFQ